MTKPLLQVLSGKNPSRAPIWLMRQAGRYLPEYKKLRDHAGSFMKLCLNPELAAEVTLQPVKRFGMDAAILFSDILIVPYALGYALEFIENEGPKLETIGETLPVFNPDSFFEKSKNIYETVRHVKAGLPEETALIGFAGSPFTVACYMLGGKGKEEFLSARLRAYQNPAFFKKLLMVVAEASAFYLNAQIKAGAETIQLFDSWSSLVPANMFDDWVIEPTRAIVAGIRKLNPGFPIIGFPRGASQHLETYLRDTGVTAVSLDQTADMPKLQKKFAVPLQGNLDPLLMRADKITLQAHAKKLLESMPNPFIFNLGHGLTPDVPPDNVAALVECVHAHRWQ